jgi:hypothetical protein
MIPRFIILALFITVSASNAVSTDTGGAQWFKKSVVTIDDLSEVPGIVLEPGTYLFKAEEGSGNPRLTVQLLNKDETQVLGTFTAVPDHRQRPDFDTVLSFFPNVTDGPKPIQTWYYPGEMNGFELIYPKERAREIAKKTQDHVLASVTREGSIVAVTGNGTEVPIYDAPGQPSGKLKLGEEAQREKPQDNTSGADKKTKKPQSRQP